jgi:mannan endo-1,4-beta-mannosidase
VVDVLGTDIYSIDFAREQYDQLLALAKDKPIALAEVGAAPSPEILKEQPRWTWFMFWGDPMEWRGRAREIRAAYNCYQVITFDKLPWVEAGHPADHTFTQP